EARARVAIAAGDAHAVERFIVLAMQHRGATRTASTVGARLLDEAKRAGLAIDVSVSSAESAVLGSARPAAAAAQHPLLDALAHVMDPSARAARALDLLAESAGARAGYLYYALPQGVLCVACLNTAPDRALDRFASGYIAQHIERAAMTTVFTDMDE